MSQQGSVGPSVRGASGPERQVVDLEMLVVAMRLGMETGRPSQGTRVNAENAKCPIGLAGEPLEMSARERPTKLQRAGISPVVRLQGVVVGL